MDGGLDATHNGVRVDDDVDPSPGLSGITENRLWIPRPEGRGSLLLLNRAGVS